jgi:streptomycin 6-kinase
LCTATRIRATRWRNQTGVPAVAIWEWGFLERVSTGLYIMSLGEPELARPFLETAELLA